MSNDVERLRGERADLQHKLAHWQRVAEESEAMAARRVEAMLRYAIACLTEPDDDRKAVYDQILAGFRALPATPAPEGLAKFIAAQRPLPPDAAKVLYENREALYLTDEDATPAPGPSAEDALRWACANERRFQFGCYETEWEYVARGLADLTRAPGGQDE